MDFSDIIVKVSDGLGISLTDMAGALGTDRNKLYNFKGGRFKPNYEFLRSLMDTYPQVSAEFLITGKGEVLKSDSTQLPIPFQEESNKDVIIEALADQLKLCKMRVQDLEGK